MLCMVCTDALPLTQYHLQATDNFLLHQFFLHKQLTHATALYHFIKKSVVYTILEYFKYKGNISIGFFLGKQYGLLLQKQTHWIHHFDSIIPVPLHRQKLKKRGYNQSAIFAQGLSSILSLPCQTNVLVRTVDTSTQTKKKRIERFKNMEKVFTIKNHQVIEGKNILLIDDVVTTGATLNACIETLSPSVKNIAIVAIAMAT